MRLKKEVNRKCMKEAEDNGVFYKSSKAWFEVFENDYETGEGRHVNSFDMDSVCSAKTLEDLLNKVQSALYMKGKDYYWYINPDDSSFRVSYLGNNDSDVASEGEIEAWKEGDVKLYNIDGIITVQKVMGEMDVPEQEMRELAKKANVELM